MKRKPGRPRRREQLAENYTIRVTADVKRCIKENGSGDFVERLVRQSAAFRTAHKKARDVEEEARHGHRGRTGRG